jgi:hypothetical protein
VPINLYMAKAKKQPHEQQELKPEMRDLILRFDAKDRRDESGKNGPAKPKERRRRGAKTGSR